MRKERSRAGSGVIFSTARQSVWPLRTKDAGMDSAVLRAVDELWENSRISDATWATLSEHFNRQQLMDAANVVLDDNTITSHVKRIRRKFQALDPKFDAIQTVYGMGYRWVE